MNHELEFTIDIEVMDLSMRTRGGCKQIAQILGVPVEALVSVTLFRRNGGFMAVIIPIHQRLNYAELFRRAKYQWCTEPNEEELQELGAIDVSNPFILASNERVQIIIDAKLLAQQHVVVITDNGCVLKTDRNGFMIAIRSKIYSGISLPNKFDA